MEYINKVELAGRIGSFRSNEFLTSISIMTQTFSEGADGSTICDTTWVVVDIFNLTEEQRSKIAKGVAVKVVGRLKMHKYTGIDGEERQNISVLGYSLEFLPE